MRILITGSTGLLGPYLMTAFSRLGEVSGVSTKDCDLTVESNVQTMFVRIWPKIIVHAAAMTNVDECSVHPNKAVIANCGRTENLIRNMPTGCRFIYISTDMVYSGHGPHREHSKSENPINMYGMSKFMGEYAAAKAENHLIIRTNLYGLARTTRASSLVDFFLGHLKSQDSFNVFTDSFFNPLWTKTLADNLAIMARTNKVGTFNLGASTSMSKAKFAMLLANEMGLSAQGMRPVAAKDLVSRTVRPLDTRIDISRAEMAFALTLPSMENDIKAMCADIKCTN